MVAFSFQRQFGAPIRADEKLQTIRATRRCGPGQPMHLYVGMRTKTCELIAIRSCVAADYVHIAPDGLILGDVRKHPRNIDEFARLDGFSDFAAMQAWFAQAYPERGGHFIGHVHRWAPRPTPASDTEAGG